MVNEKKIRFILVFHSFRSRNNTCLQFSLPAFCMLLLLEQDNLNNNNRDHGKL